VTALLREAAVVCLCVIVVRLAWVFPSTYVGRSIGRRLRRGHEPLPSWRQVLFVGWAGMRGGDSLVIALALPFTTAAGGAFPARDRIVFLTFCVILATLVLQGPTLRPLARRLALRDDGRAEEEEAHARLAAAEAGLRALAAPALAGSAYPEVARYLRQRHGQRARRWASREARRPAGGPDASPPAPLVPAPSHDAGLLDDRRAAEYRRLRSAMIRAERRAVRELRDRDEIGDDVLRAVQRDLDLEQVLLGGPEPVIEPPRETPARVNGDGGRP
jgi:CPA1 family monovalent cation:H+ antiporter